MTIENIIRKPAITEKGTYLIKSHKYVFYVDQNAGKQEIKKAIKKIYKVDAIKINIISGHGKVKRVGRTRRFTKLPNYKKAIVTIKPEQKIEGFESAKE
jgi:large subunit ribosomal protein L23